MRLLGSLAMGDIITFYISKKKIESLSNNPSQKV
jgi:hypothetical protein